MEGGRQGEVRREEEVGRGRKEEEGGGEGNKVKRGRKEVKRGTGKKTEKL